VLYVSGPMDWLDARARERAFRARARSWGMRGRPMIAGDWSADFGYAFAVGRQRPPQYSAIVAANDEVALGLAHRLHDPGLWVPDDPVMRGLCAAPCSRHWVRALTTGRLPCGTRGGPLLVLLLAALEGLEIPRRTTIPRELIVRLWTAKARSTP